jgi:hypothetical protein
MEVLMSKVDLHLGKVPRDPTGELELVLTLFQRFTGKKPTPEDIEQARQTLAASGEIALETASRPLHPRRGQRKS